MKKFLAELKRRNALLYWFGWFNMVVALICILLMPTENIQLLNVNRWLKPTKFYLSVGIMTWTMGWILYHLSNPGKVKKFSWIIVITMAFENGLILLQAARKTTSHFNTKTAFDGILFSAMGLTILVFTITFIFITIAFFQQKTFNIPEAYLWGIRLGLVLFILFSLEAGFMLSQLKHTIGAEDGTEGIPVFNWSRKYGDLRVAHFFGLHALQVLPLAGWYIARNKRQEFIISAAYFTLVLLFLIQALKGIPLFF